MRNTITRASSWNPTAKFIILFNNVGQRKAEGKFVVDKIFQEIAIKFHVNHILLLFAKSASKYDIYVSRLFRRSEVDSKCSMSKLNLNIPSLEHLLSLSSSSSPHVCREDHRVRTWKDTENRGILANAPKSSRSKGSQSLHIHSLCRRSATIR